jgi:hypothetical protein
MSAQPLTKYGSTERIVLSMSRNSVDCCAPDERDILQRHYKLSALLKANTPDEGASLSFLELAPFL